MNKLLKIWVYSNLHIAAIAFFLSLSTNFFFDLDPEWKNPLFIFFATLFLYNLGFYPNVIHKKAGQREHAVWMTKHTTYWALSLLSSLIALLYLYYSFSSASQWGIGILAILSLIYVLPQESLPIRSIRNPVQKTWIVAFIWTMMSCYPNFMEAGQEFNSAWIFFFLSRFFFIWVITLMFDVRDMQHDPENFRTLPRIIGMVSSKSIALLALSLSYVFFILIDRGLDSGMDQNNTIGVTLFLN